MPVKNAGKYLKPCIESILAQSYENWELIAINDSSTDGSNKVLIDYAAQYFNIITADSSGKGIIDALRTAYKLSSGVLIHRMDADDLMPLDKLKLMSKAVETGAVVTGKVNYFCDEREVGEGFQKYTAWLNGLMEDGDFWRDVYRECPIPSSAWMMYRTDFERIGGFYSDRMPEDYDLAFRMLKADLKVVRLDDVIHHWRDSETRTSRNEEQYFPIAYLPLKVRYFLELHRDYSRSLILWGAGKKGKLVAKELIKQNAAFDWITGNHNKIGHTVYGKVLRSDSEGLSKDNQIIIAVSAPLDMVIIQEKLEEKKLIGRIDYFWFC